MSKNYAALAQQIVAAIGGVDNVAAVTHCMTRLRFVVKDDEQVDPDRYRRWRVLLPAADGGRLRGGEIQN